MSFLYSNSKFSLKFNHLNMRSGYAHRKYVCMCTCTHSYAQWFLTLWLKKAFMGGHSSVLKEYLVCMGGVPVNNKSDGLWFRQEIEGGTSFWDRSRG